MIEFEINGVQYRSDRMDAKKQFHVARRLAPLLAGLGGSLKSDKASFSEFIGPIADALSKMSDEDTDYVIDACLRIVQRRQGQNWQAITARSGDLMFDDIDLPVMLRLTVAVIQQSLGGFFPGGPSISTEAA